MSSTGRDLITAALKKIGCVAPGESPDASEASDGLLEMNRMLSSWSNEGLFIYAITQETPLVLTGGKATYTLGTGGDIGTRPKSIEAALIRNGSIDYPLNIFSLSQFAAIQNKSVQSNYPTDLYDDGGYPLRTITLFPVPSTGVSLILFTKHALSAIATLDTAITLPEGFEDAIIYNLAKRLAPEYGKAWGVENEEAAVRSIAGIKRANHRPSYLVVDDAIVAASGRFNINTGGVVR